MFFWLVTKTAHRTGRFLCYFRVSQDNGCYINTYIVVITNLTPSIVSVFSSFTIHSYYFVTYSPVAAGSDEYMLSKTVEFGRSMNIDDVDLGQPATGWSKWDEKYFIPFFRSVRILLSAVVL